MSDHLSKQFDSELESVSTMLMRMGGVVEEQLRNALLAFAEGDRELAEQVIARDADVDELELSIDDACTHIVARRQPTAIDLRKVMAIGKAVTDLERVGDEAKKIAKTTRKILERDYGPGVIRIADIRHMGEQATGMLRVVLDAFTRLDCEAAARIVREDKEVDMHFSSVMRQLVTYMMEDPRTITTALDIIFVAKSIERIGDHCKNVAEDVIYIAEGRDVRHAKLRAADGDVAAG